MARRPSIRSKRNGRSPLDKSLGTITTIKLTIIVITATAGLFWLKTGKPSTLMELANALRAIATNPASATQPGMTSLQPQPVPAELPDLIEEYGAPSAGRAHPGQGEGAINVTEPAEKISRNHDGCDTVATPEASHRELYYWRDEQGVQTFSDKIPPQLRRFFAATQSRCTTAH